MAAGESRKWMILVATIWMQAFTGTNFDFSAYSSSLKSVLGISQVQLNYLAVASDMGKFFGWSSGLVLLRLPLPVVMFMSAFMGFVGYGLQWLVIRQIISVPYILVLLMCLLAGCSICWFNTVCFVLCIRNFPSNRALALSLTVSFNGVTAALYALIADSIDPTSPKLYLLLNALIPLLTSLLALTPILLQPDLPRPDNTVQPDSLIFLILNILAVFTGIYLMLLGSSSYSVSTTRVLLGGAVLLLVFPVFIPGITYARAWFHQITTRARVWLERLGFVLVGHDELELHKGLICREGCVELVQLDDENGCCETVIGQNQLRVLGEEHPVKVLVRRLDFWLYYVAYFCGGTIGLVYSNNLGQIAQSLGQGSETTRLVTVYSAFSFFGRLLSAAPDYVRAKVYFARTGWLAMALVPTPIAFFLLAVSGSGVILHICTALIGLSSGFIFAAAVSITSELFGPKSVGVNHNILITNIPIGSLLYGLLAALVYDANTVVVSQEGLSAVESSSSAVCFGRDCYFLTFVVWGCTAVLGLTSSFFLFLRTRPTYDQFERTRIFYTY